MTHKIQIKEIEFKQATCSNRDYQLKDDELKFELESKEKKWDVLKKSLETTMADSISDF